MVKLWSPVVLWCVVCGLQELSALMRHRASQEDMRSVVSRAVGLALQAHRDSSQLCEGDAAAASRSR